MCCWKIDNLFKAISDSYYAYGTNTCLSSPYTTHRVSVISWKLFNDIGLFDEYLSFAIVFCNTVCY